jgi:hypothetical protein
MIYMHLLTWVGFGLTGTKHVVYARCSRDNIYNIDTRKQKHRIIISLLMSPLLGHRPSLWITHRELDKTDHAGPVLIGVC